MTCIHFLGIHRMTLNFRYILSLLTLIIAFLFAEVFAKKPARNYLFDMGSDSSVSEKGYARITESSKYNKNIGYGWIKLPHRSVSIDNKKTILSLLSDGVIAETGLTFRTDLPDGDYYVSLLVGNLPGTKTKLHITINDNILYQQIELPWLSLNYRFLRQRVPISGGFASIKIESDSPQFTLHAIEIRPVTKFQKIEFSDPLEGDTVQITNLVDRLKQFIIADPANLAAVNQLDMIEKYMLAAYFYHIGWWSWAVKKTGLSIFDRFHIASALLRQVISDKNDPLYDRSLYLLGKIHYWLYQEQNNDFDRREYESFFAPLIKKYSDHQILRMYNGEKILHQSVNEPLEANAPEWAKMQHEALCRILEIIHWWVDNRQLANGELGGKYGDDVEILRWWLPAIIGADDPKALEGYQRLVDGVWNSGLLKNAYSRKIEDVEHSAELFSDTHPAMLLIDYGNPVYVERCMQSMQNFAETWTAINAYGHRHFKSCYLSADQVIQSRPEAVDVAMNARATLAGLWLGWYNHDPYLIRLLSEWGLAWVEDGRRTDKGKPQGVLPAAVRFDNDEIGGYSDDWFDPRLGWDYYEWKYLGGIMEMYNQLLGVYDLTGNVEFLNPLQRTYNIVRNYDHLTDLDDIKEGSERWVGAVLNQYIKYSLMNDRSFPQLLGRSRILLDTDQFDDYLKAKGRLYSKYLLTGNQQFVIDACRNIIEDIKYNFPMRTSEVKFTDRVNIRNADELLAMYTGGIGDGKEFPSFAVTWSNTGSEVAILVRYATKNQLKIRLYNFGTAKIIQMKIWRLPPGNYPLSIGICHDNRIDSVEVIHKKEIMISERGENLELDIPAKKLINIEIVSSGCKRLPFQVSKPDLAVSPADISLPEIANEDQIKKTFTITIHNIGSEVAENIQVAVSVNNHKIGTKYLERLDPPEDLHPSKKTLSFDWRAKSGQFDVLATIIYDHDEITKSNNKAVRKISVN